MIFFFRFFFQSDRPTQNQETHSTVNEGKKWRWPFIILRNGLSTRILDDVTFVVMTSQAYGIKEPGNKDFMPAILDTTQTTNCTFNLPSAGQTLEEKL